MCTGHAYWLWNIRSEREMDEAKKQGRWIVYERMRQFNPTGKKSN